MGQGQKQRHGLSNGNKNNLTDVSNFKQYEKDLTI